MQTTWLIASSKHPTNWEGFKTALQGAAEEHGKLKLLGMLVVEGPGCINYGMLLEGEESDAKVFVEQVCMVLQPGKYSGPIDPDPRLTPDTWICEV